MKNEFNSTEISSYLYFDKENTDILRELPDIINLPLKLFRSLGEMKVIKMHDKLDLTDVKDEFANSDSVNTYEIMQKIFLMDGRLYKHYRLLNWFPKYMEYFYHS